MAIRKVQTVARADRNRGSTPLSAAGWEVGAGWVWSTSWSLGKAATSLDAKPPLAIGLTVEPDPAVAFSLGSQVENDGPGLGSSSIPVIRRVGDKFLANLGQAGVDQLVKQLGPFRTNCGLTIRGDLGKIEALDSLVDPLLLHGQQKGFDRRSGAVQGRYGGIGWRAGCSWNRVGLFGSDHRTIGQDHNRSRDQPD